MRCANAQKGSLTALCLHSIQSLCLTLGTKLAVRNEGVRIVLDRKATEAWKAAGEKWEGISSRIVIARLKLAGRGQRQPGGSRERSSTFVTVITVYAPTAKLE